MAKKLFVFLLFTLHALCFTLYGYVTEANHPYIDWSVPHKKGTALITYNYDGDTLTTSQDTKIRLLGVNTPEIKPYQEGSREAKQFTEQFCRGKEADIVVMTKYGSDKYGRTLALVFVDDKCLNWELLKNGHAEPMVFPQALILKRDMWESGNYEIATKSEAQSPKSSGWAKLIKAKEPTPQETSVSTVTARAVLTQSTAQPLIAQQSPVQSDDREALVMAFGGKKVAPVPDEKKEKPKPPVPRVIVGNVVIESGKTYNVRLIVSGAGHYVLEVVLGP